MFKKIDGFALGLIEGATEVEKKELLKERKEAEEILSSLGYIDSSKINADTPLLDNMSHIDSDKILCFDSECIEDDDDYAGLFYNFLSHLKIDLSDIKVKSVLADEKCDFTIKKSDKTWHFEWSQNDDYITQEFLDATNQVLHDAFDFKFFALPAQSQEIELLFLKSQQIDLIEAFITKETDFDTGTVGYFVIAYLIVGFAISLVIILSGWLLLDMLFVSIIVAVITMIYFLFKGSNRSDLVDKEVA